MLHKAWSSIEEVPYCFWRSSVKFQSHTALKIVEFDPNWAFPDCNSILKSPMATKWCTKLETAQERCPIVFQGHPSNFKVTRDKTSPILTQIGRFRTIGRSQLSNPSDLSCYPFTITDAIWIRFIRYQWVAFTCRFKQLFAWLCASFRIWSREMAYIDDNQNKEFAFVSTGLKSLKRVYKLTSKACLLTVASCILGQIEQFKDNTILVRGNHEK